ncbi:hypothetical protein CBER1_03047 [Cercospora berteroae]|uniref:Ecp2 effector protein domain-containing protein n=1 Tax=Cercospora berteroae TaxID=357750 RepID=A0A2S6CHC9_9PEZI|nr:hypothetical protein CBER1_03047 [Cercospora berteroae]
MHFTKFLLHFLSFIQGIRATPTPVGDYTDFQEDHHLLRRNPWPDALYPRVRVVRYTGCRHNMTNYAHLQTRDIQTDRCITFDAELNAAHNGRDRWLNELKDKPHVTKEDIERANHPENYIFSGLYWQFPGANKKHLLMPMERCNVTIFSEPKCKVNSRIVKMTNEASDVCVPAIGGKSIFVDCYSADELKSLNKAGLGVTDQWRNTAILRYGAANATGFRQQLLLPPIDKDLNKTYDSQSDEWQRTCQGRKNTHKGIFKERIERCSRKTFLNGDDCDWHSFGHQWLGDFGFAEKC